ncbi:MAG: ArsR/SmtB family transcription factor [bacterium]
MGDFDSNIDVDLPESDFRASRVHRVMGNPLRYRMLNLIGANDGISSGELADELERSLSTIDYHLDNFKELDLVFIRKEGQTSYIHIKRNDIYDAIQNFKQQFER